ncbi:polysaccharide deacetylase family protein [Prosthecobacter sp.]|uniref:polysaccharide deacetylase family protein n=1 Tax=Prosthecobacter sp. TaxID=1965333 RepID=UPI001D9107CE|nr:polysaccharide deacetylase family protein [Prosthecobacter sp.]MCB1278783.1 polysaccharide deacetylase family protein [Prosthecobacter sp.]
MPFDFHSRAIKAAALIGSGLAQFARARRSSETTILSFHGLSENVGDSAVLDWTLHLPVEVFRNICSMLAKDYRVISMAELIEARSRGAHLPDNSVIITFDDGYASNYELAYPILREFDLHATVFVTTGFLDGEDMLWFQRVDLALGRTRKELLDWKINGKKLRLYLGTRELRQQSLVRLIPELKELPDTDLLGEVDRFERALEVNTPCIEDLPKSMRPMTWEMARVMSLSGYVDIGGHTHTHPILARCDSLAARAEISTCRDRIRAEIGDLPVAFCYPNGGSDDYTRETMLRVREAGFKAACTAISGRVTADVSMFELPRYGSPESVWEAEATVSGAFETLKDWRRSCLKAMSMI